MEETKWEDLDVDGMIILEFILGKSGRMWTDCIWLSIGISGGSC
jgi:hypothetical protein